MSNLRQIQEEMQAYVLEKKLAVSQVIQTPANMTVEQRLHVYRNAYYLRLIEILEGDFTVLNKILGGKNFSAMIRDYLDAYPSHDFSVRSAGRHVAKFLKNREGVDLSFSELAEFEWALNKALFSKDAPTLTLQDMTQIAPEKWSEMTLILHPSVQILCCHYNTSERWQFVYDDAPDPGALLLTQPLWHLIWRHEYESYFCPITEAQQALIYAIQQGESFGTLCESMLKYFVEEEVVAWVASTLQTWIQEGVFSGVVFD